MQAACHCLRLSEPESVKDRVARRAPATSTAAESAWSLANLNLARHDRQLSPKIGTDGGGARPAKADGRGNGAEERRRGRPVGSCGRGALAG